MIFFCKWTTRFFIIISYFNSILSTFTYFTSIKEYTNDTLVVSEDGIYYFDESFKTLNSIQSFSSNKFTSSNLNNVQIIKFPSSTIGFYLLCKIKNNYYLINDHKIVQTLTLDTSSNINHLVTQTCSSDGSGSYCRISTGYIQSKKYLVLKTYKIRITKQNYWEQLNATIPINNTNLKAGETKSNSISCQILGFTSNSTQTLTCFYTLENAIAVTSVNINDFILISGAFNIGTNAKIVKSIKGQTKNLALVCYNEDITDNNIPIHCLTYNLNTNVWSEDQIIFSTSISSNFYDFDIIYNDISKVYVIYSLRADKQNQVLFLKTDFSNQLINEKTCIVIPSALSYSTVYMFNINYSDEGDKYYFIYTYLKSESQLKSQSEISINCDEEVSQFLPNKKSSVNKPYYPSSFDIEIIEEEEEETEEIVENQEEIQNVEEEEKVETDIKIIEELEEKEEIIQNIEEEEKVEKEEVIQNIEEKVENEIKFKKESEENCIKEEEISNNKEEDNNSEQKIPREKVGYILPEDIEDIIHYVSYNGEIIKGESEKTAEEIVENLNKIVDSIELGQIYEIKGEDYEINIQPINNDVAKNKTYVDFSECEKILRETYSIPEDEILTTIQIEINSKNEQSLTNNVEYAVYDSNKNKLDLSPCNSIKINYEIKDGILNNTSLISSYSEQGVDILNIKDEYFNSICYPDNNSTTDIVLEDRVKDIYQNYSICDSGCEYNSISLEDNSIECICPIKSNITIDEEEVNFAEMITTTFKNTNFEIILCYSLVFNIEKIFSNIGFLIFSLLTIVHIPLFIHYCYVGKNSIKIFIFKEMHKFNYINLSNPLKKKKISNNNISGRKLLNKNSDVNHKKKTQKFEQKIRQKYTKNLTKPKILKFNLTKNRKKTGIDSKKINNNKNSISIYFSNFNISFSRNKNNFTRVNQKDLLKEPNFPGYYQLIRVNANGEKFKKPPNSKYILTNYNYNEAIKYEDRDFWVIFYICLFFKQSILHTFLFKSSIELQSLRICHFIFSYSCGFALNALFYSNNKISDRYHYEGENLYLYSLINNITISITSTAISLILKTLFHWLINSKKKIENVFREQEKKLKNNKKNEITVKIKILITQKIIKILKLLKIKIFAFLTLETILMVFFTYYISAFCAVYKGTQISWLSDSVVSFIMSNLLEILVALIIAVIYTLAIKYQLELLYRIAIFVYDLGH